MRQGLSTSPLAYYDRLFVQHMLRSVCEAMPSSSSEPEERRTINSQRRKVSTLILKKNLPNDVCVSENAD